MNDCGNDMHTTQYNTQVENKPFINIPVLHNVAASHAANFMYNILTQPCSHSGLQLLAPTRDDVAPR